VFFLDANKGFTVGGDGTILRTENSGASWESIELDWPALIPEELEEMGLVSVDLYEVVFTDAASGWIVGDSGTILHTMDGGKEWFVSNMAFVPSLFGVCFKNDQEGWAVGHAGFFLKTDDGGDSWKRLTIDTVNSLYRISIHDKYGVIVGDQATIFQTIDGGMTWTEIPRSLSPPYPWFADAWLFPSSNSAKVLSVGKSIIFKTAVTRGSGGGS
jgi:photosystem II stability/assembly factor-like uncharacterized protein